MDTAEPAPLAPTYSGLQGRILDFLGQGLSAAVVASATGVTQGYISQLLADEQFRDAVRQKKMKALQEATDLDRGYEEIEAKLQRKLNKSLPFLIKPREILEALKVINGTKRRGTADLTQDTQAAQVIEIRMPTQILNNFVQVQHTANNQIIQAGEQSLVTAQPQDIKTLAEVTNDSRGKRSLPNKDKREVPGSTAELCLADFE